MTATTTAPATSGAAQVTSLPNGLRALTVPATVGSMSAVLFVGAGSRHETREVSGTAHFLEHLFFKGTPARPTTLQLASEIDGLGCVFNAFTGKEHTAYFIKGATEYATHAVEIIADLLRNALIPADEVERERGVILQELRMYEDNPQAKASRLALEALYGDTPMGWDIGGFESVIETVSRDQIVAYREGFYAPGRMILVLSGNVEHELTVSLAERLFGDLPATPLRQPEPAVIASARHVQDTRDIKQANIRLIAPGPKDSDDLGSLLAAHLMTTILGGGMSSRLFIQVRERQGLCYSVGSGLSTFSDTGALVLSTATDPDKAPRACASMLDECDRLAAEGATVAEMEKARAMFKGRHVIGMEDSMRRALEAADDLQTRGRVLSEAELFAAVDGVTGEAVQEAARTYLVRDRMRPVVVGPAEVDVDTLLS